MLTGFFIPLTRELKALEYKLDTLVMSCVRMQSCDCRMKKKVDELSKEKGKSYKISCGLISGLDGL